MGQISKVIYFVILNSIILFSCQTENKNNALMNHNFNCDSLIYNLDKEAVSFICDSILDTHDVRYCEMSSNLKENEFVFTFTYYNKNTHSKKREKLFKKSNRFLKINKKYLPIIFEGDILFSNVTDDINVIIEDFNYGFITVNAKGHLIDAFVY